MTERERGFAKWADSVPKCIGYPTCDGDLVGTVHEDECPMSKVENSAGKAFAATYYDCWQAAFEAGREDVLKVNPASNSILDVVIYLEREELLTLIDACDIYVFSDKLNDVRSQLHRQLPAPPDSGDKKEAERG